MESQWKKQNLLDRDLKYGPGVYSSEKMRIAVICVWYWGYEPKPIKPKEIVSIFKVVIVCF